MKDYIAKQIYNHLCNLGFSEFTAKSCGMAGGEFYQKKICNSKDPFKESCDHAGKLAEQKQPDVKYRSPKAKAIRRSKKPQEAFRFDR